jgi:cysteinyl-tRNA synthetase
VKAERAVDPAAPSVATAGPSDLRHAELLNEVAAFRQQFVEAMDDDFNTARAQGHLFEIAKAINRVADSVEATALERAALPDAGRHLRELGETIGLFWGTAAPAEDAPEAVQALVRQRDEARIQKQWARADQLRDEILALGYLLEDSKEGTRVRRNS